MELGEEPPESTETTAQHEPAPVRPPSEGASSSMPWLLFVIATLVLGGLAGYFARRVSQETARADVAVADRMRTTARAKELDRVMESLQERIKTLSDELKRVQEERDALSARVKALSEKPAAPEKAPVKKAPPPPKKKKRK